MKTEQEINALYAELKLLIKSWVINDALLGKGDVFTLQNDHKRGIFFETDSGFWRINRVLVRIKDKFEFDVIEAYYLFGNEFILFSKQVHEIAVQGIDLEQVKDVLVTNCALISPKSSFKTFSNDKRVTVLTTQTMKNKTWNPLISETELLQPLRRKKETMYILNDLFSAEIKFSEIDKVMAVIALCPQHTFSVATKDAERMKEYFTFYGKGNDELEIAIKRQTYYIGKGINDVTMPLHNLWLGVQIENQEQADSQIPLLLETPAAKRFLSLEPLLEYINLAGFDGKTFRPFLDRISQYENKRCGTGIDWVVVGGASGKNAQPMHPDWVRSIRNQCKEANVPLYFKGWGEWLPMFQKSNYFCGYYAGFSNFGSYHYMFSKYENEPPNNLTCDADWYSAADWKAGNVERIIVPMTVKNGKNGRKQYESRTSISCIVSCIKVGKKKSGYLLDGVEYKELPN